MIYKEIKRDNPQICGIMGIVECSIMKHTAHSSRFCNHIAPMGTCKIL